ncbi:MAG: cation-translocating P-type ATPase [Promethearchaeota archaeon]
MELEEILKKFQTNPISGLTKEEANNRIEKYGYNEIPKVSRGFWRVYLAPLFNWLIVIYLIGALILFIAGFFDPDTNMSMVYITLGIVALNCFIAIFQQFRATKKLNALRQLSAPKSTVIRDGKKKEIFTKDIVVGDILVIDLGDKIGADARIIESTILEINEASLTGESEPVKKNNRKLAEIKELPLDARRNMIFYGTFVTGGNGKAIVVKIGGETEIGKISIGLGSAETHKIPVQEKMNNFGKWLGIAVMIFWIISLLYLGIVVKSWNVVKSLNVAMDIMPINIPLLTAIVLLTGVLAMATHGVIIRNITSVDSLGRVSVICTDKTGTLTESKMRVQYISVNGSIFIVSGTDFTGDIILIDDPEHPEPLENIEDFPQLKFLLIAGYLNNNSVLVMNEIIQGSKIIKFWSVIGNPTEGALMALFNKSQKIEGDYDIKDYETVREYPFNSAIKRMTKIVTYKDKNFSLTKGASDVLIPLCSKIILNDEEIDFTDDLNKQQFAKIDYYANKGYRVLSLCYKPLDEIPQEDDEDGRVKCESSMVYIGFVTILDPPREGVKESIKECHEAGIDVVMITGDAVSTAKAIGTQISILTDENEIAVEGKDIEDIIESSTAREFDKIKVFARVSPKHKENLVKKYQSEKKVVAMTGDGVNDALALNLADAGVAMGIQGTDVAKEAADMVISDDSFGSIVKGVHQGRGIFAKIRAVVFFFICINLFEGIVAFILSIVLDLPYFADEDFYLQWVFLSVTLHMFPGLILTFDTISDDVMKEKPRDSEEILSKNVILLLVAFGILLTVCMLITYFIGIDGTYRFFPDNQLGLYQYFVDNSINVNHSKTLTMLMVTLFFCESVLIFQIRRPNKSLIQSIKEDSNYKHYLVIGFLFLLLILLIYIPGLQLLLANIGLPFMFVNLNWLDWLVCFSISMICVGGFETVKYFARTKGILF